LKRLIVVTGSGHHSNRLQKHGNDTLQASVLFCAVNELLLETQLSFDIISDTNEYKGAFSIYS